VRSSNQLKNKSKKKNQLWNNMLRLNLDTLISLRKKMLRKHSLKLQVMIKSKLYMRKMNLSWTSISRKSNTNNMHTLVKDKKNNTKLLTNTKHHNKFQCSHTWCNNSQCNIPWWWTNKCRWCNHLMAQILVINNVKTVNNLWFIHLLAKCKIRWWEWCLKECTLFQMNSKWECITNNPDIFNLVLIEIKAHLWEWEVIDPEGDLEVEEEVNKEDLKSSINPQDNRIEIIMQIKFSINKSKINSHSHYLLANNQCSNSLHLNSSHSNSFHNLKLEVDRLV